MALASDEFGRAERDNVLPSVSRCRNKIEARWLGEVAELLNAEPVGIREHLQEDEPAARFLHAAQRPQARRLVGYLTDHRRQKGEIKAVVRERKSVARFS
jgi:hypothetical protein